jgi:hypothetical protein
MRKVTATSWIDAVARLIPVVAAALILVGVLLTIRQKERTDQKDQWWKRVQWAADAMASDEEKRRLIGISALTALISVADTIGEGDAGLLRAIIDQVDLSAFADPPDGGRSS